MTKGGHIREAITLASARLRAYRPESCPHKSRGKQLYIIYFQFKNKILIKETCHVAIHSGIVGTYVQPQGRTRLKVSARFLSMFEPVYITVNGCTPTEINKW